MPSSNIIINIKVAGEAAKKALQEINGSFLVLQASIILIGRDISKTAAEFDKAMRNVNSIAQVSEEQFKKFTNQVRELSKDPLIIEGPTGLAKAMYQLVSSGFEAADALNMAGTAAKAASAGLTSTETSVTALAGLMNAYNQKTLKDSVRFSDELFRVVDKGVISFEQLATNLGSVNSIAAAAGIEFKETGAAFIELTRAGISASEAETSIAGLIRELSNPNPDVQNFAKMLGASNSIGEMALKTKGLSGVIKELAVHTGGSLELMQKFIPETRAAKAALTLAKDGAEGFNRALGEMNSAGGSTERALAQQAKSIAFEFAKVKSTVEDLKIEYGDLANQIIRDLLPYFKFFLDYLKNLDENTKKLIIQTGAWTIGIGAALIAVKGLFIVLGPLVGLITKGNLAIAAAVLFFKELHEAVDYYKNSVNALDQAFGSLLEKMDLFGKLGNLIEAKKAEFQASQEQAAMEKERASALKTVTELREKENKLKKEGKKLSADDELKFGQGLTTLKTFSGDSGSRKRLESEAEGRIALSKKESEADDKARQTKEDNAKKVVSAKLAEVEAKKQALKDQQDAEKEANRKQKQWEQEREQAIKELSQTKRTAEEEIIRNTKSDYEYQKFFRDRFLKEELGNLNNMKKYNLDVSKEIKLIWQQYHTSIDDLNKKHDEDIRKSLEERKTQEKEASKFILEIENKTKSIGASDKDKAKMELTEQLAGMYDQYEKTKESMSKLKDEAGKNLFSPEQIKLFSEKFSQAYKDFEKITKADIEKIGAEKPFEDKIKGIKDGLTDLAETEGLLTGERLRAEKKYWQDILTTAQEALAKKESLTKEATEKFTKDTEEATKNIGKTDKQINKISAEAGPKMAKGLNEFISSTGLIPKEFSSMASTVLGDSDNLKKAFGALTGPDGLKGFETFVKDGGDISSMVSLFSDAASLLQKYLNPELEKANHQIADFFSMVFTGKFTKETMAQIKNIADLKVKLLTDGQEALKKNYENERGYILGTVFDEQENYLKVKLLDKEYQETLDKNNHDRRNNEISLIKGTLEQSKAWYDNEKSFIEKSVGNWEDRNFKLDTLSKDFLDKQKSYYIDLAKLDLEINKSKFNDSEKSIRSTGIQFAEIDKNETDPAKAVKQKTKVLQELARNLQKTKEDFFSNIDRVMNKYYDKEKDRILANHKTELDLIKTREKKIKENEEQISKLQKELDKIDKAFAKRLDDKKLSKDAYKQLSADSSALEGSIDLEKLKVEPPDEFKRRMQAEKDKLDFQLAYRVDGMDEKKHSEEIKKLATQQNVYWNNIVKNVKEGTDSYDTAVKEARSSFDLYKEAVKESIESQKESEIQNYRIGDSTVNLTDKITELTDENANMQEEVTAAHEKINPELDALDSKFKDVTGGWVNDIDGVKAALGSIGEAAAQASQDIQSVIDAKNSADNFTSKYGTEDNVNVGKFESDYNNSNTFPNNDYVQPDSSNNSDFGVPYVDPFSTKYDPSQYVDPFASTPMKKEDPGWFDKGGALGWLNPGNWFSAADGGVFKGPKSGYLGMLHGTEAVLNEGHGDNLSEILHLANLGPQGIGAGGTRGGDIFQTTINGTNLSESQIESAVIKAHRTLQEERNMSYQGAG